jgi:hypothetical protein
VVVVVGRPALVDVPCHVLVGQPQMVLMLVDVGRPIVVLVAKDVLVG